MATIDLRDHPASEHTVSLVMPTLNEARGLRRVLPALPEWLHEVFIVDGHSSDATIAVAEELCPNAVVITQQSRGKGGALKEGIRAATGTIIITMDADGSMDPGDILE